MPAMPTQNIINAINLASRLHREHLRKDEGQTPYISHLFAVAMYLSSVTHDEDIIIAGLMHDSLEDVADYEYEDLMRDCGERVASIVAGVTENKTLPYKERKLLYLENLKTGSFESLIVSVSDKLHNALSLRDVHVDHNMNVETQMTIYREVLAIATERFITSNLSADNLDQPAHAYTPLIEELRSVVGN